jgi:hypothetical protein
MIEQIFSTSSYQPSPGAIPLLSLQSPVLLFPRQAHCAKTAIWERTSAGKVQHYSG